MARDDPKPTRRDRQRVRTRAALIEAAQQLIAEGRQNVAVLEITQLADVGLGSFYNHFGSKDQLYEAALRDVLDRLGAVLDGLTVDLDDPAEIFAQSFRLTGRLFRRYPQLSRVLLRSGIDLIQADVGLAPRVRRDIDAGAAAGRFHIPDTDLAVTLAAAAILALGALLESQPDRDDGPAADATAASLLQVFGVPRDEATAICRAPLPALDALAPIAAGDRRLSGSTAETA